MFASINGVGFDQLLILAEDAKAIVLLDSSI